jgi:protein-S-isoprenylcysteine O-methyltransferase Ste14
MSKFVKLGFGLLSYSIFLVTFLYAIGFTGEVIVPKAINDGALVGVLEATVVNLALLTLFAVQHSVMARPAFKRWWTRLIPEAVERSTFVLLASSALALLFWQWRPMPNLVWSTDSTVAVAVFQSLFWSGWALVLISTFLISHFELFGVRQVLADWTGRTLPSPVFKTPFLYRFVRHPIYLGFLLAFWATPSMSVGHLLFAVVTTAYILVGIQLEEHDLLQLFGKAYATYRQRTGMLLPTIWTSGSRVQPKERRAGG